MFSFPREKFLEKEHRREFFLALIERIFLRDWGTKLIALGITLAIWFGVNGMKTTTTVRLKNIPLNLRVSNDMEITNSPVQEVELVITGDKQKIDRLNSRDIAISTDLSSIQAGDKIVQLTPLTVNLDLPSEVKLEEIQPNKIAVKLEKVLEREIEVKPEFDGKLPEGIEIYSSSVFPSKVRVRGPESIVKQLDSISTEKVSQENRKESFTEKQIGLNVVNSKITILDPIVDVNVVLGEERIERSFTIDAKDEDEIVGVNVVLLLPRSIQKNFNPKDIEITIEKMPDGKAEPKVSLPAELQDKVEVKSKRII